MSWLSPRSQDHVRNNGFRPSRLFLEAFNELVTSAVEVQGDVLSHFVPDAEAIALATLLHSAVGIVKARKGVYAKDLVSPQL